MGDGSTFGKAWLGCLTCGRGVIPIKTDILSALGQEQQPFYLPRRPSPSRNTRQIEGQRLRVERAASRGRTQGEGKASSLIRQLVPSRQLHSEEVNKVTRDPSLLEELMLRVSARREDRRHKVWYSPKNDSR